MYVIESPGLVAMAPCHANALSPPLFPSPVPPSKETPHQEPAENTRRESSPPRIPRSPSFIVKSRGKKHLLVALGKAEEVECNGPRGALYAQRYPARRRYLLGLISVLPCGRWGAPRVVLVISGSSFVRAWFCACCDGWKDGLLWGVGTR